MDKFVLFLKLLRSELPTNKKLVVRRIPMKKNYGTTNLSKNKIITVCIDSNGTIDTQCDTLIHEWGHVLEFDKWKEHGADWGNGVSKAYQVWEKFLDDIR